ncbi:hypothetical protein HAX54_003672, partial [Datura stramonium]|nr:hypothetical protein [Datura stramonium]
LAVQVLLGHQVPVIPSKAGRDTFSLKKEVQVILDEMDGKDVDVSPLMKLLKSFFELAVIYDQARSDLHDKDMKAARKELSITAGNVFQMPCLKNSRRLRKFPPSVNL